MRKAPEAFRTISEAADALDTPAHVLRFWESKFTQVKPVKRAGGRRYYRPADIDLLSGIKLLLHEQGMTIRGVQKLLQDKGVKYVATLAPLDADMLEGVVARKSMADAPEADIVVTLDSVRGKAPAIPPEPTPDPVADPAPQAAPPVLQPEDAAPDIPTTALADADTDTPDDTPAADTVAPPVPEPLRFARIAHALRTQPPADAAKYAKAMARLEALMQTMAQRGT
jgi:DNA-binding transcriptional MerR regulator